MTTYTYTVKGQLSTVTMPRPTGTQTRTFTYHLNGSVATVTQPETGTTTNTVGTDVAANDYGMLKTKVDAKGQKVEYIYDAYKRVVEVKRYKVQTDTNPDACQGTKYQYDLNTWDVGFGAANLSGRLSGVEYHVCTYNGDGSLEKDRTIREMYSYSVGGRPLKKRMQLQRTDPLGGSGNGAPITGIANLDAEYTWSQEGTLLTLKYPDLRTGHPNQMLAEKGNTVAYQTDWLRRYSGMTEATALNPGSPVTLVSNMLYGVSGELTSMTYNQPLQSSHAVVTETRQYNLLGQLTQITAVQGANTVTNLQYVFPTGTNNGRISSMVNVQSGETVTYTYDALNRLTNAVGSGWSEAYAFDGFGNLTQKGGQSIGVVAATNRLTGPGISYDSNGNQTGMQVGTTNVTNSFDIENRLLEVSGQGSRYGFGPDNRKMWTRNASNGNEDYVFWGPQGKPIGTYRAAWEWTASSGTLWFNAMVSTRRWMGSKEISASSVLIHDRLSSVVGVSAGGAVSRYRYLPYGEPNTAGGSPVGSHFATYDRTDAGMYYADQRYYRDGVGRFLTADPYGASADAADPSSWNRYAYVDGEPVNHTDPSGMYTVDIHFGRGALFWQAMFDPTGFMQHEAPYQCMGMMLAAGELAVAVGTWDSVCSPYMLGGSPMMMFAMQVMAAAAQQRVFLDCMRREWAILDSKREIDLAKAQATYENATAGATAAYMLALGAAQPVRTKMAAATVAYLVGMQVAYNNKMNELYAINAKYEIDEAAARRKCEKEAGGG